MSKTELISISYHSLHQVLTAVSLHPLWTECFSHISHRVTWIYLHTLIKCFDEIISLFYWELNYRVDEPWLGRQWPGGVVEFERRSSAAAGRRRDARGRVAQNHGRSRVNYSQVVFTLKIEIIIEICRSDATDNIGGKEKLLLSQECELVTLMSRVKGRLDITNTHVTFTDLSPAKEDADRFDFKVIKSTFKFFGKMLPNNY